jgi:hypothetical protein
MFSTYHLPIFPVKIKLFVTLNPDQISMDPHWFGSLDPDPEPRCDKKLDPDPHENQCGSTTLA